MNGASIDSLKRNVYFIIEVTLEYISCNER